VTGRRERDRRDDEPSGDLSIGRLALASLGAAAAVLAVATIVIVTVRPGPVAGLIIALVGVVGAIVAMGVVSTRMTRRAYGRDR